MNVPQTRSPTNLRYFPDRIGLGNVAFTPRVKESRFRNLGKFYFWNPEYAQGIQNSTDNDRIGIQNPSSTDKYWNPVQSGIHSVKSRIQDSPGFPHGAMLLVEKGKQEYQ